jgi:hypothetical protein
MPGSFKKMASSRPPWWNSRPLFEDFFKRSENRRLDFEWTVDGIEAAAALSAPPILFVC